MKGILACIILAPLIIAEAIIWTSDFDLDQKAQLGVGALLLKGGGCYVLYLIWRFSPEWAKARLHNIVSRFQLF